MMLKIAVPNKGALAEAASQMLAEAGYRQRRNAKDLVTLDPDNDVEFFYLRPRDIAIYVGEGTLDVGITGRDLLLDSGAKAWTSTPTPTRGMTGTTGSRLIARASHTRARAGARTTRVRRLRCGPSRSACGSPCAKPRERPA